MYRELIAHRRHAELPRRVLLESPSNERGALRIDVDRVDQSSVEVLTHVEVTNLGATGCASAHRLVQHLLLDVLAALADLDFVHDVGDSFHGVGHVPLAEVLLGGDEFHPHTREDALRDCRVSEVTEGAGAHVDHHVADVWVFLDIPQHLAKDRALGDGLSRVPRLNELGRDGSFGASGAHETGFALGGDGVPVGINVDRRKHLTRRGHSQIDDRVAVALLGDRRCRAVETEELLPTRE
nr:hypothetical protein [Microbacterium sp. CFBP 8794]